MDLCNETNIELRQFLLLEYSIKDVRAKIVQWIDFKKKIPGKPVTCVRNVNKNGGYRFRLRYKTCGKLSRF